MKGNSEKPTECARSNLSRSSSEIWDLCKNQTLNESVLTFNQKNVETNAFDVQILVFVRCHLRTTPGLNNKCPNVWKPHHTPHTTLFSSNFSKKKYFRNHRLSSRVYPGAVQPQEEQAAAHHQPQQENHHLCRLVSPRPDTDIIPCYHQTYSRLSQSQNVNLYLML